MDAKKARKYLRKNHYRLFLKMTESNVSIVEFESVMEKYHLHRLEEEKTELEVAPFGEHTHIPIAGGKGHVTWHGDNPPTEKQMKAFEKMAELASENADDIAKLNKTELVYVHGDWNYIAMLGDVMIQLKKAWNDGFSQGMINDGYEGEFYEWYLKNDAQIKAILPKPTHQPVREISEDEIEHELDHQACNDYASYIIELVEGSSKLEEWIPRSNFKAVAKAILALINDKEK